MCVLMLDGAGSWTCLSAVLSQHPQHIQHVGHWLLGSSAADTQNKAVAAMHPLTLVQLRYRDTALHSTQKMLHIISFFSPGLCVLVIIIQVDLGRPVAATSQWHEGWALASAGEEHRPCYGVLPGLMKSEVVFPTPIPTIAWCYHS